MRRFSFWILSIFLFSLLRLPFFVEPSQSADAYLSPDEPCGEVNGISQYTTNPSAGGVPDSGRMDFERALWSETVPAWSPTNLVYTTYSPGVTGTAIAPTSRLCFDPQGDVYGEQAWAWNSNAGWIDFDWCDEFSDPTSCASLVPSMDLEMTVPTSGPQSNRNAYWGGYAWSDSIGWIQFDWTCSGCDLTQRVHTQLPSGWPDDMAFAPHANMNGEVDGYAWNDRIGWINFGHTTSGTLTQELPFEETLNVLPEVTLTPDPVDVTKYGLGGGVEPILADGEDAYVLSVKLFDVDAGTYLNGSYNVDITVTPTTDSFVGTYQTLGGDPSSSSGGFYGQPQLVKRGAMAPYVMDSEWMIYNAEWQARNLDAVFVDDVVYNAATQAFEVEIKSWAPTSNMNGADDNGDGVIDRYFDRDSNTATPSIDRNKWAIESIDIAVNSGPHTVALNSGAAPLWGLDATAPGDPIDLKFTPPLEITNLAHVDVTDYDDDGDTDNLLSYIPSFTPVTAPYTLFLPFEGFVALWSSVLQTLPGIGLNFSVDVDLQTLDTDPQAYPYYWSFGIANESSSIPILSTQLFSQLSGGFSSIPSAASIPSAYKWRSAPPPALHLGSYWLFLNSIMGSVWTNNFNGSTNGVLTDYSGRSAQYVPPLASSVDFEPFGESYVYGVDNSTGPSPTDWGLVPYYGHELETARVTFCPSCTLVGADLLGYNPTTLPQFSYHTSIAYDAYLGLNADGKEMYTRISYYNNEVPSVGSLAPSPYLYDVPVSDEECPGCSGVDVPGSPGYGSPNAPWIGGGAPVSGIPTLLTDDGLKLPAVIVGSISGSNVASVDDTTVVGAASRTKIRNQIYKRFSQLKKGVNLVSDLPFGSDVNGISVVNGAFAIDSDNCTELLNGDLIYCLGDTELMVGSGVVAYPQITIVVEGGDLYVATDVMGDDRDALGLVVFEDLDGEGGDIYVNKTVTDLVRVNMYADGSVRSYDTLAIPTPWSDFSARSAALTNQLYISGSVVSANTVGGLATLFYGGETDDAVLLEAGEEDLNNLREFQVCWVAVEADLSSLGQPSYPIQPVEVDTTNDGWWDELQNLPDPDDIVSCGTEYGRSVTLGANDNEPVRLEYLKPPPGLPLLGGVR